MMLFSTRKIHGLASYELRVVLVRLSSLELYFVLKGKALDVETTGSSGASKYRYVALVVFVLLAFSLLVFSLKLMMKMTSGKNKWREARDLSQRQSLAGHDSGVETSPDPFTEDGLESDEEVKEDCGLDDDDECAL